MTDDEREDFEDNPLDFIRRRLTQLEGKLNKIMATQVDLDAALDKLAQAVSDAATRVSADFAALNAKIAAGTPPADLSPEVAKVQAGLDAIASIDPAAPAPIVAPTPTP